MFTVTKTRRNVFPCPICGYGLPYPAADFNICPSCGVEFGYETAGRSFSDLRKEWIASGRYWASPVIPQPVNWNPWLQLIQAGYIHDVPFTISIGLEEEENTPPVEIFLVNPGPAKVTYATNAAFAQSA